MVASIPYVPTSSSHPQFVREIPTDPFIFSSEQQKGLSSTGFNIRNDIDSSLRSLGFVERHGWVQTGLFSVLLNL